MLFFRKLSILETLDDLVGSDPAAAITVACSGTTGMEGEENTGLMVLREIVFVCCGECWAQEIDFSFVLSLLS